MARGATERIVGRQSSMDMNSPLASALPGRAAARPAAEGYVAGHDFARYVPPASYSEPVGSNRHVHAIATSKQHRNAVVNVPGRREDS